MTHTPGPWDTSGEFVFGAAFGAKPDIAFSPIGGCGCCGSPWIFGADEAECQANKRLIDAAPRMLEALRAVDDLRHDNIISPLSEPSHIAKLKAAFGLVAAALQEAGGPICDARCPTPSG